MPVQPFRWDLVPRIPRAQLAVRRALGERAPAAGRTQSAPELARLFGGPSSARLGALSVIAASEVPSQLGDAIGFSVAAPDGNAFLAVDASLALAAAGRVLGYRELLAPRPPTGAELGVVTYVAAQLAAAAGVDARLWPAASVALPDPWAIVAELSVALGELRGRARLFLPERMLHALPLRAVEAPDVPVRMAVRRGRVRLPADQVVGLRPGDVVLCPAAGAVPLACLGRLAARVELGEPARITLSSGFSEELMASDILDHAEVDLVVHLGHVVVSARQLAGLAPGAVLELDRPLGGPVELYVGKTLVGRGEVVDIDGQLGVRVIDRVG